MRTQLHGIYISLMVHGMAAILLYGVSHGITPTVRTVALDFSLDSGGRIGEKGSAAGGGSGGDEAQPQNEASPPKDFPGDRKVAPPMNPGITPKSSVSDPPPSVAEEQPPVLKAMPPAAETLPPVDEGPVAVVEAPPPVLKAPPPVRAETPPTEKRPTPARRILPDDTLKAILKTPPLKPVQPKPVPRKNTVDPVTKKKAKPDPSIIAAIKTPPPTQVNSRPEKKPKSLLPMPKPAAGPESPSLFPGAGSVAATNPSAEIRANSAGDLSEGSSGHVGTGSLNGPDDEGSGNGGALRGDGGTAYLGTHFNFIRGHLREHLCYPSIARKRGWSGEVMVSFTIYPDGRADDIAIRKSCGISLLDKSALKTVYNASPFPNPPMAARIVIPIVYQLN